MRLTIAAPVAAIPRVIGKWPIIHLSPPIRVAPSRDRVPSIFSPNLEGANRPSTTGRVDFGRTYLPIWAGVIGGQCGSEAELFRRIFHARVNSQAIITGTKMRWVNPTGPSSGVANVTIMVTV